MFTMDEHAIKHLHMLANGSAALVRLWQWAIYSYPGYGLVQHPNSRKLTSSLVRLVLMSRPGGRFGDLYSICRYFQRFRRSLTLL